MPIKVPRGPKPKSTSGPSDTDFLMALAQMEKLGRLPEGFEPESSAFDQRFRGTEPDFSRRLDPLQGQVEDRRTDEQRTADQIAHVMTRRVRGQP